MLGNWITIHDLGRLKEKLARGQWRQVVKKFCSDARGKTRCAWEHTQNPPVNAWDMPAQRQRWNRLVSGDAAIDHVAYIAGRYLGDSKGLKAFSPGCGGGGNEIRWAETGVFARIDACDLSAPRIASAVALAERRHLSSIVRFSVGDMRSMAGGESYDLVIAEGALHHFYPLRAALKRIRELLKPGGLLVANDFAGPSRFQWTHRQLQAANELLDGIPAAYRRRWEDGKVKKRIDAPGRLRMILADPSEAAESSLMLPLLKEMFLPLEIKEKGGALSCLLFHGIAHHYLQEDETALGILSACFAREDQLMASGEIASDYFLGVFRKPET